MPKFRKKPVVVEAEQYRPGLEDGFRPHPLQHAATRPLDQVPYIRTLEGDMVITPGDWIITGVQGERYPCKPDVFEQTYEPVPGGVSDSETIRFHELRRSGEQAPWND